MYRYHEQDDVSPMPSATFSRWFRAHEVLKGREDKKEGERGHESVTQGLFQSRRRSVRHYHAFELSSQSERWRSSRSRLEAREHGGVHEHLLLLLRRLRVICSTRDGELINIEGDPDHPVNQGGLCPKAPRCSSCATWWIPPRAR